MARLKDFLTIDTVEEVYEYIDSFKAINCKIEKVKKHRDEIAKSLYEYRKKRKHKGCDSP